MVTRFLALILALGPLITHSQIIRSLEKRYMSPFGWSDIEQKMTDVEKVSMLSKLPDGDTLQFRSYYDEEFYPLDTNGIHYVDLDLDGDLDLIYQSMSGNMGRTSSKVYIQEEGVFNFVGIMNGRIIKVGVEPHLQIHTYEHPCCDSYTNSIREYSIEKRIQCIGNIVYIALPPGLRGLPDFKAEEVLQSNQLHLYISPSDLRNGGYFQERTREIHSKLRSGTFVNCARIPDDTQIGILDSIEIEGKKWHLIITEAIAKPDSSLYETWQTRHIQKSHYVGWTTELNHSN